MPLVGKKEVKTISWKGKLPETRKLIDRFGPYSPAREGFRPGEGIEFQHHRFHFGGNEFLDVITRKEGESWKINLHKLEFNKEKQAFNEKGKETIAEFGKKEDAFQAHLKLVDIIKEAGTWEEVARKLRAHLD